MGAIVDAGSEQDADGDAELVTGNNGTADLLWRQFGHIQDDDGRHEANTKTCDQTTSDKKTESRVRGSLEDDTDDAATLLELLR